MSSKNNSTITSITSISSTCTTGRDSDHPTIINTTIKTGTKSNTVATSNYYPHFVSMRVDYCLRSNKDATPYQSIVVME